MRELPKLYRRRQGQCVSLFLDVTDTWFVGHGPDVVMAAPVLESALLAKRVFDPSIGDCLEPGTQ